MRAATARGWKGRHERDGASGRFGGARTRRHPELDVRASGTATSQRMWPDGSPGASW